MPHHFGRHEYDADCRISRCGSTRGHRCDRTRDRSFCGRDRQRPSRSSTHQFDTEIYGDSQDKNWSHIRCWRLRCGSRKSDGDREIFRGSRRTSRASQTWRQNSTRYRRQRLCRNHRWRRPNARTRENKYPAKWSSRCLYRHIAARSRSCDVMVDDRQQRNRYRHQRHRCRLG